jgi:hypothetical protein
MPGVAPARTNSSASTAESVGSSGNGQRSAAAAA